MYRIYIYIYIFEVDLPVHRAGYEKQLCPKSGCLIGRTPTLSLRCCQTVDLRIIHSRIISKNPTSEFCKKSLHGLCG